MLVQLRLYFTLLNSTIFLIIFYALFLKCFFPMKQSRMGFSNKSDLPLVSKNINETSSYKRYDHVILMVIDAMRSDFILGKETHMKFTKRAIGNGFGLNFTAKVNPPTVTLPRIKALTTGGIPGFVDVVLNFGCESLQEDNIITQMKRCGKNLVFYGDDTWIKLFPQHFIREEGTTSFFVTDYTEVDSNVTRHLADELNKTDWTMMILHYLGLDHIGHMSGPFSPLIKPKLEEMDQIIEMIYKQMEIWDQREESSMMIVCGDHGMSDQGGHGGASQGETSVPVIFLSPSIKHYNNDQMKLNIKQIDLAPTLARLMDIPIPLNNLGTIILDSLIGFTTTEKVQAIFSNAYQVSALLQFSIGSFEKNKGYILYNQTSKRYIEWLEDKDTLSKIVRENQGQTIINSFIRCIELMTDEIQETSTVYDIHGMIVFILFIWLILVLLLLYQPVILNSSDISSKIYTVLISGCGVIIFIHLTVCTSQYKSMLLCNNGSMTSIIIQVFGLGSFMLVVYQILSLWTGSLNIPQNHFKPSNIIEWWLLTGTIIHTISLLSSSFVEEEHQTWYFYVITIHVLLLYQVIKHIALSYSVKNRIIKPTNTVNYNTVLKYPPITSLKQLDKDEKNIQHQRVVNSSQNAACLAMKEFVQCFISLLVILFILRLSRMWNQTGNKWLDIPDFGDWLIRPENIVVLSVLTVVSLVMLLVLQYSDFIQTVLLLSSFISTYCYRVATTSLYLPIYNNTTSKGSFEARISFFCSACLCVDCVWYFYKCFKSSSLRYVKIKGFIKLQSVWIAIIVLVLRPHNISLVTLMVLGERLFSIYVKPNIILKIPFLTLYCYWMGQAAFFYQGNSNSLTTVDVSAGYIGLEDYQPVTIGVLMTCSTYAGVVFWFLILVKYLLIDHRQNKRDILTAAHTLLVIKCLPIAVYTILVTIERYHLFVWTVFSPKVLYEGALLLLVSVFVLILLIISVCKSEHLNIQYKLK